MDIHQADLTIPFGSFMNLTNYMQFPTRLPLVIYPPSSLSQPPQPPTRGSPLAGNETIWLPTDSGATA
jgi:hypothetical protein